MDKQRTIKASTVVAVVVACLLAYYMLLHENFLHISISEIIEFSHTLEITQHVVILGLLPIYIAGMLFGAAMTGFYLGSRLQRIMLRRLVKA